MKLPVALLPEESVAVQVTCEEGRPGGCGVAAVELGGIAALKHGSRRTRPPASNRTRPLVQAVAGATLAQLLLSKQPHCARV